MNILCSMLRWFSLLMGILLVGGEKVRFDGHKVYHVVPVTQQHVSILKELQGNHTDLFFWNDFGRLHSPVDIVVPPHIHSYFSTVLQNTGIKADLTTEDLQRLFDLERPDHEYTPDYFDLTKYNTLEQIYDWLYSLEKENPGVVTVVVGGKTYEGREIRGVKISHKEGNPGVFIEAGIHANEWMGPAVALLIIDQLLTSEDLNIKYIAENFNWYIFPSVNPDGYVYTHTTNRLWRKNRRPTSDFCVGVDPNRNWDIDWMGDGANLDPCSDTYAGPRAFSEVETRTLAEFISGVSDKLNVYISFHSYGQLLMFPYGFTYMHTPQHDLLLDIGIKAAQALASRFGTRFRVGTIAEAIYRASGSSLDWVYVFGRVVPCYVYELGQTMVIPPYMIVPTYYEVMDSIVTILQESQYIYNKNLSHTDNVKH